MLESPENKIQPDFYTSKISDFLSLKAANVWKHLPRQSLCRTQQIQSQSTRLSIV